VATAREADVLHDADPLLSVPEHRVEPPEVNVSVPVAPAGRPVAAKVTAVPKGGDGGVADALDEVGIVVMTKLVALVEPAKSGSPE
jgi:hypothetical protein